MRQKKTKRLSNEVFDLGVQLCLGPINFILRAFPYQLAVVVSVLSIIVWAMPVMIAFSIVSNLIFLFEIGAKLIKS